MTEIPPLPDWFDPRRETPVVDQWDYLNHAGVAPLSARAAAALTEFAAEASRNSEVVTDWYQRAEKTRALAARLVGAGTDEIAFVKNTSEGLSFIANGLAWQDGDEVIGANVEYPANVYPWIDLSRRAGVRYVVVPERAGRIEFEAIAAAVTPRTRLVALSHVEYASGFCNDLAALGAFCRERGILLAVDAIQSLGVLPLDVAAMQIDFFSADGHKWLLSSEGAGIFYCRRELLDRVRPEVGWMNVVGADDYSHHDFTLRGDARRFECGSYNIPGLLALGASLELLLAAGVPFIRSRVLGLTNRLCAGLEEKGYSIFSSRRAGEGSGIVSFSLPDRAAAPADVARSLLDRRIVVAVREGRLRASPHFYNTAEQIDRLIAALP